MKYLIENAKLWRAHLSTEQLQIENNVLTSQIANKGHASTMNATLVASNSNGEIVWESASFSVNATNSTSVRFNVPANATSKDIRWSFEYQVRVVEVSRYVTESISSDTLKIIEQKEDNFLIGYGVFNVVTTTLIIVAVAVFVRDNVDDIDSTTQEMTCEN